jgi:ABC-type glutathione transport system ATPase component
MIAPLLDIRDLRVSTAAGLSVVRGVSLTVLPGHVLGLAGESGSGKSLTCLSALGLLPRGLAVTGGEILLDGRDVRTATAGELRAMRGRAAAIIMQNPQSCFNPGDPGGPRRGRRPLRPQVGFGAG